MALQQNSRLSLFYVSHTERRSRHFYGQTRKENPYFKKLSGQMKRSKPIWFSLQNNWCYWNQDGRNSHTQRSSQREIRAFPSDNRDCTKKPERVKKLSERGCILKSREARVNWGKKEKALKPVRRVDTQIALGIVEMICAFVSAVHIPSCVHVHFVGWCFVSNPSKMSWLSNIF